VLGRPYPDQGFPQKRLPGGMGRVIRGSPQEPRIKHKTAGQELNGRPGGPGSTQAPEPKLYATYDGKQGEPSGGSQPGGYGDRTRLVVPAERNDMPGVSEQRDMEVMAQAASTIEVLARMLHVPDAQLQPTLDAIVSAAASALNADRDAGLTLLERGKLVPQAVTGRAPLYLDLHQQQTGEGPCIEAARQQIVIRIDDTRSDPRWPGYMAEARQNGVLSQLCIPLWADERGLGTLSLYAADPSAFTDLDVRITAMFATLAALTLADALRAEQMRAAVVSRDLIGQAKGILMERHRITADAAFAMLAAASQHQNVKLTEVAAYLVETGELTCWPDPGRPHARIPRSPSTRR
jgi:GAF domain-containing protein